MKAKIAGLVLLSGIALAAQAATYHFTPITRPTDASAQGTVIDLGNQLAVNVTDGGGNTVLFAFTNSGGVTSSLSQIYFDDNPSNLFSNIAIQSDSGSNVAFQGVGPSSLPGGTALSFTTTHQFNASDGINNATSGSGESLTLAGTLQAGKTFADVVNSLDGGDQAATSFLRIGLRVTSIAGGIRDDFCGCGVSFMDTGLSGDGGASPPPPTPEPETYGMLIAGLGLISAMVRRRRNG